MRRYNNDMNELRRKRKELGLTQEQTAKAIGVSRRTYQTYEEESIQNETYEKLIKALDEIGILDGSNFVLNVKMIKNRCLPIFEKYPDIICAYLYGSYAREEATGKSDVDILVVCHNMGLNFFKLNSELEDVLKKEVDLHTQSQIGDNESFLENILIDGIKIYGKRR